MSQETATRIEIRIPRIEPMGILPGVGEELNVVAGTQVSSQQRRIVGNAAAKRMRRPNDDEGTHRRARPERAASNGNSAAAVEPWSSILRKRYNISSLNRRLAAIKSATRPMTMI